MLHDYAAIEMHNVTGKWGGGVVRGGPSGDATIDRGRRTVLGRFLPPVITRNFCSGNAATGHSGSQVTSRGGQLVVRVFD